MRMSKVSRRALLGAGVAVTATAALGVGVVNADAAVRTAATTSIAAKSGKAAPGGGTAKTLVLYDTTGAYGWLGEVYATQTANLSSHFGSWTAAPVAGYRAGDLSAYTAVIYLGSTYDAKTPFDESFSGEPLTSPLSGLIQGWTIGLTGVKVGSRVLLQIPPAYGYGPQGSGAIPGNATLWFVIDVLAVQ